MKTSYDFIQNAIIGVVTLITLAQISCSCTSHSADRQVPGGPGKDSLFYGCKFPIKFMFIDSRNANYFLNTRDVPEEVALRKSYINPIMPVLVIPVYHDAEDDRLTHAGIPVIEDSNQVHTLSFPIPEGCSKTRAVFLVYGYYPHRPSLGFPMCYTVDGELRFTCKLYPIRRLEEADRILNDYLAFMIDNGEAHWGDKAPYYQDSDLDMADLTYLKDPTINIASYRQGIYKGGGGYKHWPQRRFSHTILRKDFTPEEIEEIKAVFERFMELSADGPTPAEIIAQPPRSGPDPHPYDETRDGR